MLDKMFLKNREAKKVERPDVKIAGRVSPDMEKEVKKEIFERFSEKHLRSLKKEHREELKRAEYQKSPEELELIRLANEETNELMKKAGASAYDVPEKNFHVVPEKLYKKATGSKGSAAITLNDLQAVLLNAEETRKQLVRFGLAAFHEMFHLKGLYVVQAEEYQKDGSENQGIDISAFRSGFCMYSSLESDSRGGKHEHFRGFNEALVAACEKDFYLKNKNKIYALLSEEEKTWVKSEKFLEMKRDICKKFGVSETEITWINEDGTFNCVSYRKQRYVLDYVINEIIKDSDGQYKNKEEVFDEILEEYFKGGTKTARLVEKTFGKVGFRALGMMGGSDEAGGVASTLELLQSLRAAELSRGRKSEKTAKK